MAKKQEIPEELNETESKWSWADAVALMANKLIEEYHPHLLDAKIAFIFRMDEMKSRGQLLGGSAEMVTGKHKFFSNYDFVITICKPVWEGCNDKRRAALVDHELTHCGVTETVQGERKFKIIPHDVQEFNSIIKRHGLWSDPLQKFDKARRENGQLELFMSETDKEFTAKQEAVMPQQNDSQEQPTVQ